MLSPPPHTFPPHPGARNRCQTPHASPCGPPRVSLSTIIPPPRLTPLHPNTGTPPRASQPPGTPPTTLPKTPPAHTRARRPPSPHTPLAGLLPPPSSSSSSSSSSPPPRCIPVPAPPRRRAHSLPCRPTRWPLPALQAAQRRWPPKTEGGGLRGSKLNPPIPPQNHHPPARSGLLPARCRSPCPKRLPQNSSPKHLPKMLPRNAAQG